MTAVNISSQKWEQEVLKADTLVLVDFWAPWCPWCRKLSPDFDSLADQYVGKVKFAKVNTEEAHDLAEKYGVEGLPTLKFFCQGRPIAELVGYLSKAVLKSEIDKVFEIQKTCIEQSSPIQ